MLALLRRSIQARAVFATIALTSIALVTLGGFLSFALADGLYRARLQQVLEETERAVATVKDTVAAASLNDETAMQSLLNSIVPTLEIRGSNESRQVALLRSPDQPQLQLLQSPISADLDLNSIPDALREKVRASDSTLSYTSVALVRGVNTYPGITVGAPLEIPSAGKFELYLVYDLTSEQSTLDFVQQVIAWGGVILIAVISVVSYSVTWRIVKPVESAAEVAQQISEGQLGQRLVEKGSDVVARLAQSFNRMATNLQNQIQQLDELSRMQRRFVSDVSHELRTPMTTIKLAGEVIFSNREQLDPALKRSAELLQKQINRFELLLSDLLEISKYDAGVVQPEFELQDLNQVVGMAIANIEPLAASKQTEIQVELPDGPVEAEFDSRRVERVLRNLLSNAVEHAEGKPIRVQVGVNTNSVAVCVTDQGVGMTKQQLEHVFDRFWRADPSRQRSVGGTGLGLAIAREDVTLHRGWLQVWAKPGKGASFRITLPRYRDSEIASSPLPLPPKGKSSGSGEA